MVVEDISQRCVSAVAQATVRGGKCDAEGGWHSSPLHPLVLLGCVRLAVSVAAVSSLCVAPQLGLIDSSVLILICCWLRPGCGWRWRLIESLFQSVRVALACLTACLLAQTSGIRTPYKPPQLGSVQHTTLLQQCEAAVVYCLSVYGCTSELAPPSAAASPLKPSSVSQPRAFDRCVAFGRRWNRIVHAAVTTCHAPRSVGPARSPHCCYLPRPLEHSYTRHMDIGRGRADSTRNHEAKHDSHTRIRHAVQHSARRATTHSSHVTLPPTAAALTAAITCSTAPLPNQTRPGGAPCSAHLLSSGLYGLNLSCPCADSSPCCPSLIHSTPPLSHAAPVELMWFTGAAAKRLAGRSVDLAAHIRLHAQREAERRQQRQLDDDRRQQNQREAEAASARVAQRKERDREHAIAADGKSVHAALWRSRDEIDQWTVDASSLRPPAHMRTASDMSLPHPLLGHGSPQVSPQLVATVVRLVRRADAPSLSALFSSLPPHSAGLLSNLRNRGGDSLLHLCAASPPHMATLTQLIRCRADVNALNSHRDSPLHLACAARHNKAIKALLLAGADVEISNRDERLCWEMADTSGRNTRSGTEDDGQRRLRAFVQLLTSERDADMLAADKEDRQQADDKVRQLWRGSFYRRQQAAQRRKGREWAERQERQRPSSQSASGSSSGTQSPAAVDVAGWFHDFAERALSDCDGVDLPGTSARSRRGASDGGDLDFDHWLNRSSEHTSSDAEQPLEEHRPHTQRPRTTSSLRRSPSRPQSAVTRSLPVLLPQPVSGHWQQTQAQLVAVSAVTPRTRHQLAHRPQSRQGPRPHTAPSRHMDDGHIHQQRPAAASTAVHEMAEQLRPVGSQRAGETQGRRVRNASSVGRREQALSRRLLDSGQPPDVSSKERRVRSFLG